MSTRNLADEDLTQAVLASFAGAKSERFRELAESLVKHLHAFATEVQLSEDEWFAGIDFLTRVGHMTDDKRQEFVLLSDVLGLSMLVVGINHRGAPGATESTVFGPFFIENSPAFENGADIARGFSGEPCLMSGRVVGVDGEPVAGARGAGWWASRASRGRARASRSGRPMTTASTTSSTPTSRKRAAAAISSPIPTGASGSGRSSPRPTRSPPTARSANCWRPAGAGRCAPPTFTSWSPPTASRS